MAGDGDSFGSLMTTSPTMGDVPDLRHASVEPTDVAGIILESRRYPHH